jgi:hypothetical protein
MVVSPMQIVKLSARERRKCKNARALVPGVLA